MIVFTLDMPNRGSWNNKWSGEDKVYAIIKNERNIPKEIIGKRFIYDFGDGWTARIKVEKLPASETRKIKSAGFCGYDWMVNSIIKYGAIYNEKQRIEIDKNRTYKGCTINSTFDNAGCKFK